VTATEPPDPDRPASGEELLRRGLLGLATLGTIGTTLELVLLRHWHGRLELIAFAALGTLAVAILLVVRRPSARSIKAGRYRTPFGIALGRK